MILRIPLGPILTVLLALGCSRGGDAGADSSASPSGDDAKKTDRYIKSIEVWADGICECTKKATGDAAFECELGAKRYTPDSALETTLDAATQAAINVARRRGSDCQKATLDRRNREKVDRALPPK